MRAAQEAFRASAPSKRWLAPWNAHCSEMVRTASDLDSAFVAGAVDGDQAMLVLTAPVIDENRSRFVVLAAGNRMPTIYEA
jgi:hypothetical protein